MNKFKALKKFQEDLKLIPMAVYDVILEEDNKDVFEFGGKTHKRLRPTIKLRDIDVEEKQARIFSYFSKDFEEAFKSALDGESFYSELKFMLQKYLAFKNNKKVDAIAFGLNKTHSEMFPNALKTIGNDYSFDGKRFRRDNGYTTESGVEAWLQFKIV